MAGDLIDARQGCSDRAEVAVVLGTRAEAVALVPVVRALRRSGHFSPLVVSTGQRRGTLDQVLRPLGVKPDIDLTPTCQETDGPDGRLGPDVVEQLGELLAVRRPDAVLVHGGSATAFGAALAACSEGIRVGHLGAGLRLRWGETGLSPEEANQRLIALLARWHLVSTPAAAENLVAEGIDPVTVAVTGTTVVDTVLWAASLNRGTSLFDGGTSDNGVLACLRFAEGESEQLAVDALQALADDGADVVLPLHLDGVDRGLLAGLRGAGVRLVPPLDYLDFVATMRGATLVVTDSTVVEEEASALGRPVSVVGPRSVAHEGRRLPVGRAGEPAAWSAGQPTPVRVTDRDGAAALRVLDVLRRALLPRHQAAEGARAAGAGENDLQAMCPA
jgi:UDP-N-acetylglucosamine 2-epimerase (non-hydrolysing)